jgi:hypothetical protein
MLRPWTAVFAHGHLQISHVFPTATRAPAASTGQRRAGATRCADLASLRHGHEEHRPDLPAGNSTDVDIDVIRGWWSLRSLRKSR